MSYDSKCFDLAAVFLSDTPDIDNERNRDKLAQHIQTAIEDWITCEEVYCDICGEARGNGSHDVCRHLP